MGCSFKLFVHLQNLQVRLMLNACLLPLECWRDTKRQRAFLEWWYQEHQNRSVLVIIDLKGCGIRWSGSHGKTGWTSASLLFQDSCSEASPQHHTHTGQTHKKGQSFTCPAALNSPSQNLSAVLLWFFCCSPFLSQVAQMLTAREGTNERAWPVLTSNNWPSLSIRTDNTTVTTKWYFSARMQPTLWRIVTRLWIPDFYYVWPLFADSFIILLSLKSKVAVADM